MWGRVEPVSMVPGGIHCNVVEFGGGVMERKYFMCLLKRKGS
jgi:hypothetical protein